MATNIRNFSIIAHIDHGKSTLADRMLELTGTIEPRRMQEQVLDRMDLERERGITIKMQPVRMIWEYHPEVSSIKYQVSKSPTLIPDTSDLIPSDSEYILNLIDTPGHVDFSYEVSRALTAVEGVVLLVDSTQGVEAQTLSVLSVARELGRVVVPVVSKIDAPNARVQEITTELARLLGCAESDVLPASGKTGEGVPEILDAIVKRVPPPRSSGVSPQALVFDFGYSDHRGVLVYARVFGGSIKKGDTLKLVEAKAEFTALEVGILSPEEKTREHLSEGEIGYIVTGIKKPGVASVGDTVTSVRNPAPALSGYSIPTPVIWASVYPESQDDLVILRQSLERLRLSDSSLSYEEESSGIMGRGFRCGFLGMLHLEIIVERLRREFNLNLVVTMPTTAYEVTHLNGEVEDIYAPAKFPEEGEAKKIRELWSNVLVITPPEYLGGIAQLMYDHEGVVGESETLPDGKTGVHAQMPLRELMRGFFDRLKSVSSGFASLSYEIIGMRDADVVRLDVLVAEEPVPAFARIVSRRRLQQEAEAMVEKLEKLLPRQMFELKIQAKAAGRILASRRKSAMKKDVTQHMYGGDITRKMKLREKQKKGKKKMLARGRVDIPHDVFLKVVRDTNA
ncbi:elongation factor 4 [Candidatus Kaiserbacteria bacterium RIFCSPHIGHO2_02_FULL_55_25]|uniref:Elongation factor 4 n=1 Tax=Candidatus Kaiserbacteria bacterium RIFCSPHIGHO2_02_FULL_55_25 TaxID=1798498 RepID=A0A1F6E5F9_9BACT|nr:MAG: elongation factor 4 [Candidatus Kaiserbacteria bacterium RIFCSPHIGHO2_01_FULL_55_79]OGG68924.1 MAG: elongation factor 4 [Candidatus Kaiserbacteria bacterium RIFCSPHIGHO2_02_FULL_55_25]OGG78226.1 MAG: elongation factor 4 [Candidatus Kaiserbacteria bacterium RIFCSPHIGHO2_12_FULL_55_13]OGG83583.1 MAG: elongation factor 4 [Candidatus Kaiserbacteria bacterium RIFCSPLOWO2_01_FULL_55_25]